MKKFSLPSFFFRPEEINKSSFAVEAEKKKWVEGKINH
jgi:hypothetical protein